MKKLVYVERQFVEWVSIEKVFRQVAEELDDKEFETTFEKAPSGNNLSGIIKNLIRFRPSRADLYHITGQIHYMALVLPPERTVLTIHDLRFLHDKTGLRRYVLKKLLLDIPLKRLRYITAVSEATRQEIAAFGQIDPERIHVIENPLRSDFVFREAKAFDSSRPVILQVGTLPNKNIPNLVRAIEGLACKLVIVGKIDKPLAKMLSDHDIQFDNKVDLNDLELVAEYESCDIVSFCSTYEGFGLPIIEAQAMRKPIVTGNRSPMKEVAGKGAILADPDDPASIREAITRLINDGALRTKLVDEGTENVKRFSSATIARRYADYYNSILRAD